MNKLIEKCIQITDGEHGTVLNDDSGNYFLLSSKNISNNRVLISSDERKINKETFNSLKKKTQLETKDVIISTVGSIGKSSVIEGEINYVFQRSVGIIKTKKEELDPYFLKYQFDSPEFQKRLIFLANGGLQKGLYIDDLKNILIDVPDIKRQKLVASLLKKYDDKISKNLALIDEIGKFENLLFDYWFLQFDFPNENNLPFKSSGGKMIWNEKLNKNIPENWEVKTIKDLCSVLWGQCPQGQNILSLESSNTDNMLYCSGAGDMKNGLLVDCQAKTNASRRNAVKNDILLSVAGSVGDMCIADQTISIGRAAAAFRPKNNDLLFCYLLLSKFSKRLKTISGGSIQKVLNDDNLNDVIFACTKEKLKEFSKYNYLLELQISLGSENKELVKMRDFLIPLLYGGQLGF